MMLFLIAYNTKLKSVLMDFSNCYRFKYDKMKKIILIIILILTYKLIFSQTDTIFVQKEYQNSYKKPIPVEQGSVVYVSADSMFIINTKRLNFYENLRQLTKLDINCSEIINSYENSLKSNSELIKKLTENLNKSDSLKNSEIKKLSNSIMFLQTKLAKNQHLLSTSSKQIGKLKTSIKKQKRKTFINYAVIGISGIITGILITGK